MSDIWPLKWHIRYTRSWLGRKSTQFVSDWDGDSTFTYRHIAGNWYFVTATGPADRNMAAVDFLLVFAGMLYYLAS